VQHARVHAGGTDCYFAVMTHDHALDQSIVEALVRKPFAYLGVIGSRRKAERFRMRLSAAGFSPAELERVKSPMGVSIKALTAQEIAISVVAELIALRRSKEPRNATASSPSCDT
jgi:xanthine dehydrogenase accessory factor